MTLQPWKFSLVLPLVVEMALSNEQRVLTVQTYFSENESIVAVKRTLHTR